MRQAGHLSRRGLLAATTLAAPFVIGGQARAQAKSLNIIGHRVHRAVLTGEGGGKGGDVLGEWLKANGVEANWSTFDVAPLHERLLREASLNETSFDVAFMVNTNAVPRALKLMEPIENLQKKDPIEDFAEIAPGMVKALTLDGAAYGVPMRHATTGLHYNEQFFSERGLSGPPRTIEEMIDFARKTTFQRDGAAVNGFAMEGVSYVNMVTLSLAYDAPFIAPDLTVLPNEKGMVETFKLFRDLFSERVLPRNFPTLKQDEVIVQMQQGRIAMCHFAYGRYFAFNDAQKSSFPGKIRAAAPPAAAALSSKNGGVVGTTEFWSFVIPRNSKNKELAWSLVKAMSAKEAVIRAALNGNGPVRPSAYNDPRIKAAIPYAETEARTLAVAQPPLPAFDRAVEAGDALAQTVQAVAIGQMTPEQAITELKRRVQPLVRA